MAAVKNDMGVGAIVNLQVGVLGRGTKGSSNILCAACAINTLQPSGSHILVTKYGAFAACTSPQFPPIPACVPPPPLPSSPLCTSHHWHACPSLAL